MDTAPPLMPHDTASVCSLLLSVWVGKRSASQAGADLQFAAASTGPALRLPGCCILKEGLLVLLLHSVSRPCQLLLLRLRLPCLLKLPPGLVPAMLLQVHSCPGLCGHPLAGASRAGLWGWKAEGELVTTALVGPCRATVCTHQDGGCVAVLCGCGVQHAARTPEREREPNCVAELTSGHMHDRHCQRAFSRTEQSYVPIGPNQLWADTADALALMRMCASIKRGRTPEMMKHVTVLVALVPEGHASQSDPSTALL